MSASRIDLRRGALALATTAVLALASASWAGEFDRLEPDVLGKLLDSADVTRHTALTSRELLAIEPALADARSPLLLVKTDKGNVARLLVEFGLRKSTDPKAPAVPVCVVERFDTFEPGRGSSRVARGAGLLLFDGFQLDLDSGAVVPAGQGGDLAFRAEPAKADSPDAGRIEALAGTTLVVVRKPVRFPAQPNGPSPGKTVVPHDFQGRYRIQADGRWTGLLDLTVDESRVITGLFRSEPGGTSYPIRGQVATDPPNKATFTVKFPRTEQEHEVYLWTEGKSALAGTFQMLGKTYGVYAVREGTAAEPTR